MSTLNWTKTCGVILLWATAAVSLPAQTFTTLHSFSGKDGIDPIAALVQGTDGNLYGSTLQGGTKGYTVGFDGYGVVFAISTSGAFTTVHDFDGMDGIFPFAGLFQASNGDFYGTTWQGGTSINTDCENGFGTLFRIVGAGGPNPPGTLMTIYDFCPNNVCATGAYPMAPLLEGADGYLYGTAGGGGSGQGYGTIYKATRDGTVATVYSFCAQGGTCPDGSYPSTGLIQAPNGDYYGTTIEGGSSTNCTTIGNAGCGTIFKITPSGVLTTLHSFDHVDGQYPFQLVLAANGRGRDFLGPRGTGFPHARPRSGRNPHMQPKRRVRV